MKRAAALAVLGLAASACQAARFKADVPPLSLGLPATLPDVSAVAGPAPAPATPDGWDAFAPPVAASAPSPGAPTIAEFTRTGGPNDSLALTGDLLSAYGGQDTGKDTQFLVYGQSGGGAPVTLPAAIRRLNGLNAVVTLPAGLPAWSTYLLWPGNSAGFGLPVVVNRTEGWWLGFDQASPGDTVSLYGRNLSHNGGTTASWVYLQAPGAAGQWAQVTSVNPYRVQFTVPSGLADGTYQVWVHNGHGGNYGWSGPLALTVRDAYAWNGQTFNVRDYGAAGDGSTDDSDAVNTALYAALGYGSSTGLHPTLYFPAGVYLMRYGLPLNSDCRMLGDGASASILRCSAAFANPQQPNDGPKLGLIWSNSGGQHNVEIRDLTLDAGGNVNPANDGDSVLNTTWTSASDVRLAGVRIISMVPGVACASLKNITRLSVSGCEFDGGEVFLCSADENALDQCSFYHANQQDASVRELNVSRLSLTGCVSQDANPGTPAGEGQGRLLAGNAMFGSQCDTYVGDNTTIALGPQPGDNAGEQVLCEGSTVYYEGVPQASTSGTVAFSGLGTDYTGQTAVVVAGKGLGQHRRISAFDASSGTITVSPAWNVAPDATSEVLIEGAATRWAVYHNSFSGKPFYASAYSAMAAVELFGGCYDWVCDSNTISSLRHGFYASSVQQTSPVVAVNPCFFNTFANNTISSCYDGLLDGAGIPANPSERAVSLLGNVFRANQVSGIATNGIIVPVWGLGGQPSPAGVVETQVFEHNSFTGLPQGADLDNSNAGAVIADPVLYQNSFALGGAASAGSFGIRMSAAESPALAGDSISGFASAYAGSLPGFVLELPYRCFVLAGSSSGPAQTAALTIADAGTAPVPWVAASDSSWLTVSSGGGSAPSENSPATIQLTANPRGLAPGLYAGTVTVTAGGQTKRAMVVLQVGG